MILLQMTLSQLDHQISLCTKKACFIILHFDAILLMMGALQKSFTDHTIIRCHAKI